ncbi:MULTISPECIES: DUF7344 domain-containing protein [Haloarcula]|uniref:DUF7344 domain-containing protein n=2 Tax=Haloarcula TaxID=2237 RepID=A0A8J7Y1P3_9EURY|nr:MULTISPECIES: hypothetical protein [Halomicroarcula]MBV0923100.1 hypothetical protein [Halomicroarcula limicola]MBX0294033.1 hypothetical protein [Halomicroarcula nitratireducens]
MEQNNTELSRDRVFDILSSPRRRYVLYFLRTEPNPIQLTDLAEHVAAWENDTTVEELSTQQRKRVYVSLYQTHLPKLADSGLVEYDEDSGEVSISRKASEIDPYLGEQSEEPRWYLYYLGLAVLSTLLIAASVAGLGVAEGTVAMIVVGAFVVLTAVHVVYRWRERPPPVEFTE